MANFIYFFFNHDVLAYLTNVVLKKKNKISPSTSIQINEKQKEKYIHTPSKDVFRKLNKTADDKRGVSQRATCRFSMSDMPFLSQRKAVSL
jgi:hypothetical protein